MSTIRRAALPDAARLAQVHFRCWHETYAALVPPMVLHAFTAGRGEAVWGRILGEPAVCDAAAVYLAEVDGSVAGFASCGSQRTAHLAASGYDGEISTIYLLQAFQGRGLGGALLRTLAADLRGRGCAAASLWVLRDNARARRFYDRRGGRLIAERTEMHQEVPLVEVAYGWPSLEGLCDPGKASNA